MKQGTQLPIEDWCINVRHALNHKFSEACPC